MEGQQDKVGVSGSAFASTKAEVCNLASDLDGVM